MGIPVIDSVELTAAINDRSRKPYYSVNKIDNMYKEYEEAREYAESKEDKE